MYDTHICMKYVINFCLVLFSFYNVLVKKPPNRPIFYPFLSTHLKIFSQVNNSLSQPNPIIFLIGDS